MSHILKRKTTRGETRYQVIFTRGGYKSLGCYSTKRDAEAVLRRAEHEWAEGPALTRSTFATFAELWLKNHAALKKPSTRDTYRNIVNRHLVPAFGPRQLTDITTVEIQGYVTDALENLSPRTVNKTLTMLHLMFRHAELWGYARSNPVAMVERPKEPHREMDYLRPDEVRVLLSTAREADVDYYPLFAAAIYSGAREAELLGLKYSDVGDDVIYIRRTYSWRYGFDSPKTPQSRRAISVPRSLVELLGTGPADTLLFTEGGEPLVAPNMVRDHFEPCLKSAGLRHIRFHDLRHTYATLAIATGCNVKWLQRQMGHTSITTTLDRYGHLIAEVGDGAAEKVASLVGGENVFPLRVSDERAT